MRPAWPPGTALIVLAVLSGATSATATADYTLIAEAAAIVAGVLG